MTYLELLKKAEKRMKEAGIDAAEAENDSWLLMEKACRIDLTFYLLHKQQEPQEEQAADFRLMVDKRCERIPLQYITGEQSFMGFEFTVNPSVLIPRQDTETLVETAIRRIGSGMRVLDVCTGSGCILISVLKLVQGTIGTGCDISKQALAVAKENARRNGVSAVFEQGDLLDNITDRFDVILSNPPYIPTREIEELMPEVARFEPMAALDGREDGLFYYRKLIPQSREHLLPGGFLMVEIGSDQSKEVADMMRENGFLHVHVIRDLAGHDRVVTGDL